MDKEQLWEEHFCKFPTKDFNVLLEYRKYIIGYAEELAKMMCDKQKEICARKALVEQEYINNNKEKIVNTMQIYSIEKYDSYCFDVDISVSTESILNSPYPEELL